MLIYLLRGLSVLLTTLAYCAKSLHFSAFILSAVKKTVMHYLSVSCVLLQDMILHDKQYIIVVLTADKISASFVYMALLFAVVEIKMVALLLSIKTLMGQAAVQLR